MVCLLNQKKILSIISGISEVPINHNPEWRYGDKEEEPIYKDNKLYDTGNLKHIQNLIISFRPRPDTLDELKHLIQKKNKRLEDKNQYRYGFPLVSSLLREKFNTIKKFMKFYYFKPKDLYLNDGEIYCINNTGRNDTSCFAYWTRNKAYSRMGKELKELRNNMFCYHEFRNSPVDWGLRYTDNFIWNCYNENEIVNKMTWKHFKNRTFENLAKQINKIDLKRTKLTKEDIYDGKCYMNNILCGGSTFAMSNYFHPQKLEIKFKEEGGCCGKNVFNGYMLCDFENKDYPKEDYYKYIYEYMYEKDLDPNHIFKTPNRIYIPAYSSYSFTKNCRAWSPFSLKRILNLKFTKFITEKHKLDINTFKKLWKLFINHFKKSKHEFSYDGYYDYRSWERKKKLNWWDFITDSANFNKYLELQNDDGQLCFTYFMEKKHKECAVDSEEFPINYPELNYDNNKDLLNDLHILFTYAFISHKSVVEEHKKRYSRFTGKYNPNYSKTMKQHRTEQHLKNIRSKCKWNGKKYLRSWDDDIIKKEGGLTPITDWIV